MTVTKFSRIGWLTNFPFVLGRARFCVIFTQKISFFYFQLNKTPKKMSKLLINCLLYVIFLTICDLAIARPKYDNYQDQLPLKQPTNDINNAPFKYPDEYQPATSLEKHQNLLQALMNSRNPEDEAYVRYYKNFSPLQKWPNQDWINNYQFGKRNSNSCEFLILLKRIYFNFSYFSDMSMCHFKICNMGRRKKF